MSDADAARTVERWLIRGRVQGVGYRAWMVGRARPLGIDGLVRNRPDGQVEAVVAGPRRVLAGLLEACRDGPAAARVSGIEVTTDATVAPAEGSGFSQRRA